MKKFNVVIAAGLVSTALAGAALAQTAPATPAAPAQATQNAPAARTPKPMHHAMMSRHRVEAVQTALNNSGEHIAVDGFWGPKTETALKDFQQHHNLTVTGHLDHATIKDLPIVRS